MHSPNEKLKRLALTPENSPQKVRFFYLNEVFIGRGGSAILRRPVHVRPNAHAVLRSSALEFYTHHQSMRPNKENDLLGHFGFLVFSSHIRCPKAGTFPENGRRS